MIDSDTDKPNGRNWAATNVEYAWSMRAPFAAPPTPDTKKVFDYPAYLYLKAYRFENPDDPSPTNIRTEDVEYEFYEMSHELNSYDFDVSMCYRANNYEYLHFGFVLSLNRGEIFDGNHLDRRLLEIKVHATLADKMQIKYERISGLEINHNRKSNDVTVFFTLLGPTINPGSPTGLATDEPSAANAKDNLAKALENESFRLTMTLTDDTSTEVEFVGKKGSIKNPDEFMVTVPTEKTTVEEYITFETETAPIIIGLIIGLLIGVILAAVGRVAFAQPMPSMPGFSISNPLPSISFHNKKSTDSTTAGSSA
jgi:hypothetical protein